MVNGWAFAAVVLFVLLFGVVIVLLMRILTQQEIIVRAIPLGSPRVQERRPSSVQPDDFTTRPVGGATATPGRHA
jgi:hypothetical protein